MYTKKFSKQYPHFQDFMEVHAWTLENFGIPEDQHKKIYQAMKIANLNVEFHEIEPDLLPWLTADMAFCKQHFDEKDQRAYFMMLIAVLSGETASLEWLIDNNIAASFDEEEGETLEYFLPQLIMRSKNMELLQWGIDKKFISVQISTSMNLIFYDWLEGFLAFNQRFPQLLLDAPFVPESYLKKIFAVCQSPEGLQFDHFLWQIKTSNIQPKIIFQWLTGNLAFYRPNIINSHVKFMILCGLRSGNPKVCDWLVKHQFIIPPVVNQNHTPLRDQSLGAIFPIGDIGNYLNFAHSVQTELAYSRNTAILEWALNNHLLLHRAALLDQIIRLDWVEGFEWYVEKFREDLTISIQDSLLQQTPPQIYLLVLSNAFDLLKLCTQKWPFFLEIRHNGMTMAHAAAACNNFKVLRLLQKEGCPWMNCQTNQHGITYLHMAAFSGQFELIPLAKSCSNPLLNACDKWSSNIAVYALNSGNVPFFNQILPLIDNPHQLHGIRPIDKTSIMAGLHGQTEPNSMQTVLNTLNQALDSNFLLQSIAFLTPIHCRPFQNIMDEINQKLARNKIPILILFLAGWMDKQSSVYSMLPELFLHICESVLLPELSPKASICWRSDSFFMRNKQANDVVIKSCVKGEEVHTDIALAQ